MAYRDNVTNLAAIMGISNDPQLREEDLAIAGLRFVDVDDHEASVEATHLNRGGRLFFEMLADNNGERVSDLTVDDALRARAAEYFAELWEPNPIPGKRVLLDAIRTAVHVEIIWK